MTTRRARAPWQANPAQGPDFALAGAAGATIGAVLLAAWKLPVALILPAASLVLLLAGFALAVMFWDRTVASDRPSYRDVAAVLVFFGFAAALLCDTSVLAPLLEPALR